MSLLITGVRLADGSVTDLAVEQGRFVEERFIKPYRAVLDQWSANFAAA